MKIAILTPTFSAFSGIDRVSEMMAKDLSKKGNKVTVFTFRGGLEPDSIEVRVLGMPRNPSLERLYRLLFFFDRRKIVNTARELKEFDEVICKFYPMTLIAREAKRRYGTRYVYYNYGVADPELFNNPFERIYMRIFRNLSNRSAKGCDEAVSISKYLQTELKRETGIDSRVEYIQIDKKRFRKAIKGDIVRKRFGLGNDPICLYVGRISPHKGIHLLIESFNMVLKRIPSAKLIITGKPTFPDYMARLQRIAGTSGKDSIVFTGFVSDEELPYYYSACDVYTTATLWEGFDMPIVEAAAFGKPSVAFDIGPHPEVLKKGKLVPREDTRSFAEAIIEILG